MNEPDCNDRDALVASYLSDDPDFAKQLVEKALYAVLEGEMTELRGLRKVNGPLHGGVIDQVTTPAGCA